MPTVTVVNIRHKQACDFRCDRTTPVGNPYWMHDETERDEVCDSYEEYFYRNLNPDVSPSGFLEYLDKILITSRDKDITIGCWCAPKRCHCDTIKQYVETENGKNIERNFREKA